jgi:hypothetical protein
MPFWHPRPANSRAKRKAADPHTQRWQCFIFNALGIGAAPMAAGIQTRSAAPVRAAPATAAIIMIIAQ